MSNNIDEEVRSLHPTAKLEVGSFVLYRSEAAIISDIGSEKKRVKLDIQTQSGKKLSVRPKDILLLSGSITGSNSSPADKLSKLTRSLGCEELEEGWKLLQEMGCNCSLQDLAEAVFAGSGPCELYNAFCLINETPYFKGRPEEIMVRSTQEVAEELERKQRKQLETEHWQRFYQHFQNGEYSDEDQPFIEEIEAIAYGEKQACRLFREIKLEATPENAHEWLLRQQLWSERFNPYLQRMQIAEQVPELEQLLSLEEQEQWRQLLGDYQGALKPLGLPVPDSSDNDLATTWQQNLPHSLLQTLEQIVGQFCSKQPLCYPEAPVLEPKGGNTGRNENPLKSGLEPREESCGSADLWHCESRRDLTQLRAWAIDDPWSEDPDDAISLESYKDDSGQTQKVLWVHIADPASLLPLGLGSKLAVEAMQRGATVYIPEGTSAMLPKDIVKILGMGLQPVNMAISVRLRILSSPPQSDVSMAFGSEYSEPRPTIEVLDLCRSWVRVQRLSYDEADQILSAQAPHALQQVWQLCQAHEQLRLRNHAVQFNMYNTKIVAGDPIKIESLPNTPSRNMVAEAMLMTGAAMAQFAHDRGLPIAFLGQAPPKEALPPLDSMANMFVARKSMSPSVVRSEAYRHASIGVPMYTRGTSPLRRYLDLLTHQQLHAFLLKAEGYDLRPLSAEELLYCTTQAEMQISRVHSAQRNSQQHWQMLYLKQEGKKRLYRAIVLDIRNSGGLRQNSGYKALCSLPEVGIETIVFSKEPLRLNQELKIQLKSVHISKREAHFQIAENLP